MSFNAEAMVRMDALIAENNKLRRLGKQMAQGMKTISGTRRTYGEVPCKNEAADIADRYLAAWDAEIET